MDDTNGEEAVSLITKLFCENEPTSKRLQRTVGDSEALSFEKMAAPHTEVSLVVTRF